MQGDLVVGAVESFTELLVGVREACFVRAHERVTVDVARRVLTHELTVQLDYLVRREATAAEQLIYLAARQPPPALTVAHLGHVAAAPTKDVVSSCHLL